jgi:tripartite-type tricarboxylate transporter receptor subunit TctC
VPRFIAIVLSLLFCSLSAARAGDVADFYTGKTVRMVVGVTAGSAFDLNARAVARYLPKYLAGHPNFIVQNQQGAGAITMTNTLCNVGPFDGTAMGAPFGGIATASLFEPNAAKFDPRTMNWVGTSNQETYVGYVASDAPLKTFDDAFKMQIMVGAQGPGVTQYDYPTITNAMPGTKFKVISGYPSAPEVHLALARGEVQGVASEGWLTLKLLNSDWLRDRKIRVFVQWGIRKNPDLPDVPLVLDYARTEADRAAFKLMFVRLTLGRPFFLPPGVPPDRVQAMRRAFDAVMKDPAFIKDEQQLKLEVNPLTGEAVTAIVKEAYQTPPDVAARLRALLNLN